MRKIVLLASLLLLAGCTESDWTHLLSYNDYPPDDAPAAAAPAAAVPLKDRVPPASDSARQTCTRVAQERSTDAAAQGFDGSDQQQVYDKSYADCMRWALRASR